MLISIRLKIFLQLHLIHNNEKLRLVGNFFVSISVEGFEEADDGRRGQGHDAPKGGAVSRKSVGIG